MKLEREPVFGHLTLSHKSDPESFDFDELSLDSNGLKSGKVIKETETLNGHLHDLEDSKNEDDRLLYLLNDSNGVAASKLDCFEKTESLKSYKEYQPEDFVAPFAKSSSEIEPMDNETGFYTNKRDTECEMPELQVCYRESGYTSVKDICIDEGVRSRDKILFEESSADEKSLCTFVFHDQDMDKEFKKNETGIGIHNADGLKPSAENELSSDLICAPKAQVHCDTKDEIGNDISEDKIFPENVVLKKEIEADNNPHFGSSICEENALPQVQISSEKADETTGTASTVSNLADEKLDDSSERAPSVTSSAPDSVAEEPRNSVTAKELSYSSKVEKRRITFDFNSSTPVEETDKVGPQNETSDCLDTENTSRVDGGSGGPTDTSTTQNGNRGCDEIQNTVKEDNKSSDSDNTQTASEQDGPQTGASGSIDDTSRHLLQSGDSGQHHKTLSTSIAEEGLSGSQFVSGHFQFGESSFSAAGPLSGRINYSGPVPYSGSISLRSDSSTTSTRSFAFPVLQNEWNSSPVRMAKADRRFRKHRGWRQGILCCRF